MKPVTVDEQGYFVSCFGVVAGFLACLMRILYAA